MNPIDDREYLFVVFDVNPRGWAMHNNKFSNRRDGDVVGVVNVMEDVSSFLNSFLCLNRQNRLCLQVTTHCLVKKIWPVSDASHTEEYPFNTLTGLFASGVKEILEDSGQAEVEREGSLITGALCRAMCMINRDQKTDPGRHYRILVIQSSDDCARDYVKFMNCVFSAGKQRVVIDAVSFGDQPSVFLQQGCHWTNGILVKPNAPVSRDGFVQLLMTQFLPSPILRKHMPTLDQKKVDLKATCFCCHRHQEIAYVCPVCLAIYCKQTHTCPTCNARLPKLLKRR